MNMIRHDSFGHRGDSRAEGDRNSGGRDGAASTPSGNYTIRRKHT